MALIGGSSVSHAAGTPSSAFALQIVAGGTSHAKVPDVVSSDGSLQEQSAVPFPENPLLEGGLLNASAKNGAASASVASLKVGNILGNNIPPELKTQLAPLQQVCDNLDTPDLPTGDLLGGVQGVLDQLGGATADSPIDLSGLAGLNLGQVAKADLTNLCGLLTGNGDLASTGLIKSECKGNTGTTTVENLSLLGGVLDSEISTEPNSTIGIDGLLKLTINEQVNNPNGTFTVNAVHLDLGDGQLEVVIASATCGRVTSDPVRNPRPGDAPAPTPVPGNLPVTG